MSRTEFKILRETEFWVAIAKAPQTHSNEITYKRTASVSEFRAVHRLDFETQGLLLLAREDKWEAYHSLFKYAGCSDRGATKLYLAGCPLEVDSGHCSGYIGSRYRSSKKTKFDTSRRAFPGFHSVQEAEHIVQPATQRLFHPFCYEIQLITGRRHQIRAFFASQGSAINGDTLYGDPDAKGPLELFAWKLFFRDPLSQESVELEAPPETFQR